MKTSFRALRFTCLMAVLMFAVAGCEKSLSGTYTGQGMSVTFKADNKATVTILNSAVEATYAVEDNKVTLTPAGGATPPMTLTITDSSTLTGPDGSTLKKQ